VINLYNDHPRFIFTGSGPGTFSSRAWQTFARVNSASQSNVQGRYVSALTGGGAYHTDVSDKYVVPLETAPVVGGSRAVTSPFSSYLSLLGEVGVIGFAAMVGIYLAASGGAVRMTFRRIRTAEPGDPLPALLIACSAGFLVLLQMGFLDNWLEVTRITFPVWMLFGATSKELLKAEVVR
jgi:O-antigen ligase